MVSYLMVEILLGKYSKKELFDLIVTHLLIQWTLRRDSRRWKYFITTLQEICELNQPLWRKIIKELEKNGVRV